MLLPSWSSAPPRGTQANLSAPGGRVSNCFGATGVLQDVPGLGMESSGVGGSPPKPPLLLGWLPSPLEVDTWA